MAASRGVANRVARAFLCAAALFAGAAAAGQTCGDAELAPEQVQSAFRLALKVRETLDASGADVALVARAGRDLDKYGMRYSHLGVVFRDHAMGHWIVVHELNDCGTADSALYDEGLANFFLDDMFRYESLIVIPAPVHQKKIADLFHSGTPLALHERRYNMLAYPFSVQYQNSNQWLLEVLTAARVDPAQRGRAALQREYRRLGYAPQVITLSALERLGGRLFRANVAFDDQPFGDRMSNRIAFVSAESVLSFYRSALDPEAAQLAVALAD